MTGEPMDVLSLQLAALRAFLSGDSEEAARRNVELTEQGALGGYDRLVTVAFIQACHVRFSPRWTTADVVSSVASIRSRDVGYREAISPGVAERLIYHALGSKDDLSDLSNSEKAAQALLLKQFISDENLDSFGIDEFLSRIRETSYL